MRRYLTHDLHEKKVVSFKFESGKRYATESKSWLASCAEMRASDDGRVKRAVNSFLPSTERMVNMVQGGRKTTNVGAALYPGRGTMVRIARFNARVDEGLNQVEVINEAEIMEEYGNMITITSCVNNGEAYIVVYNNTERALSLPAGKLKIQVKPIISLPICRTSSPEFQELKRTFWGKDEEDLEGDLEEIEDASAEIKHSVVV
jgi:hypothetical protein